MARIKTTSVKLVTVSPVYRTRFKDLGYQRIGGDWRFIALDMPSREDPIGPFYRSRMELLADAANYAQGFCGGEPA